jgi:hypothetical protein
MKCCFSFHKYSWNNAPTLHCCVNGRYRSSFPVANVSWRPTAWEVSISILGNSCPTVTSTYNSLILSWVSSTQETVTSEIRILFKTNPHSALTWTLMSRALLPQPARNLLRPSPSLAHRDVFLADKGSPAGLRGILTADLNCRSISWSTSDTWSSGEGAVLSTCACLYVRGSGWSLTAWSSVFGRWTRFGFRLWVYLPGGDLMSSLGWLICISACHSLAWFLSPNTH